MDADHHRCQRCQLCAVDLEHGPCMRLSAARRQRGGDPAGLACRMRARPGWPWRTSALCWLAIHAAWRRARLGDASWALKISSRTVPVAGWCAGSGKAMSGSWRLAGAARPRSGAAARTGPPRPTGRPRSSRKTRRRSSVRLPAPRQPFRPERSPGRVAARAAPGTPCRQPGASQGRWRDGRSS